eukprot:TRINITY_DN3723_c1_g5_i1.p1 TRINITY_DN3723_c1_g5~~TRINITY_DN3723_c1_g5_i1.p1  ORF type:complete len:209 (-),score=-22.96 TRINITY_DN3723_c1_g5_i1:173-799(-)
MSLLIYNQQQLNFGIILVVLTYSFLRNILNKRFQIFKILNLYNNNKLWKFFRQILFQRVGGWVQSENILYIVHIQHLTQVGCECRNEPIFNYTMYKIFKFCRFQCFKVYRRQCCIFIGRPSQIMQVLIKQIFFIQYFLFVYFHYIIELFRDYRKEQLLLRQLCQHVYYMHQQSAYKKIHYFSICGLVTCKVTQCEIRAFLAIQFLVRK